MIEQIMYDLKINRDDDGTFQLEQSAGCGETAWISLHPVQIRYLAELAGLVETSDPQALRTIATLKRRMLALQRRIDHLADWLLTQSDHDHADLSYEMDYACATAEIVAEFVADFEGVTEALATEQSQNRNSSENGTVPRTVPFGDSPEIGLVPNQDSVRNVSASDADNSQTPVTPSHTKSRQPVQEALI